jgi:hypothetical protein
VGVAEMFEVWEKATFELVTFKISVMNLWVPKEGISQP